MNLDSMIEAAFYAAKNNGFKLTHDDLVSFKNGRAYFRRQSGELVCSVNEETGTVYDENGLKAGSVAGAAPEGEVLQ